MTFKNEQEFNRTIQLLDSIGGYIVDYTLALNEGEKKFAKACIRDRLTGEPLAHKAVEYWQEYYDPTGKIHFKESFFEMVDGMQIEGVA